MKTRTTKEQVYARLSKAGHILCGRRDADDRYRCDGLVATTVPVPGPVGAPVRRLAPPEGWRLDERKGVWHQTTRLEDCRAHGRPRRPLPSESLGYPFLPALVRCPKCRIVQWLDPTHLRVGTSAPFLNTS